MGVFSTTVDFANSDQVTSTKLDEIASGSQFTADAITGTTLKVVGGKLAVNVITGAEITAGSLSQELFPDRAIGGGKIALGGIVNNNLGDLSVSNEKIALGTITFSRFDTTVSATQANMQNSAESKVVTPDVTKFSPSAVKAHGAFTITGASRTIIDSLNIASITRISDTQSQVNFTANMSGTAYVVVPAGISDGTEIVDAASYDRAAGSFKIKHTTQGAGRGISFAVFGTLA